MSLFWINFQYGRRRVSVAQIARQILTTEKEPEKTQTFSKYMLNDISRTIVMGLIDFHGLVL